MTTSVTATPAPESTIVKVEKDITWIKAHALIAILAVALITGSIIGGIYLFEGLIERHDARVAAAQQAKEGVDTATTAALMAQLMQDRTNDATRDAANQALITSLIAQMKQRDAETAKQVTTDATLDAKNAGARLAMQTKASPTDVTVVNDTVTMSLPLTRIVVADLDELPQAESDLVNVQGQLQAQQIVTNDSKVELADANKIIAADKVELIATIKADNDACNVRVDKQAKKDLKRGFWATIGGVLGGAILRSVL